MGLKLEEVVVALKLLKDVPSGCAIICVHYPSLSLCCFRLRNLFFPVVLDYESFQVISFQGHTITEVSNYISVVIRFQRFVEYQTVTTDREKTFIIHLNKILKTVVEGELKYTNPAKGIGV